MPLTTSTTRVVGPSTGVVTSRIFSLQGNTAFARHRASASACCFSSNEVFKLREFIKRITDSFISIAILSILDIYFKSYLKYCSTRSFTLLSERILTLHSAAYLCVSVLTGTLKDKIVANSGAPWLMLALSYFNKNCNINKSKYPLLRRTIQIYMKPSL